MLQKELILLTLIPSIWSTFEYLKNVKNGSTKPNIVSWGMWAIFAITAGFSGISSGLDVFSVFTTFTAGIFPLIICLGTIFLRKGAIKFSKVDYICLVFSFLGMILWLTSGNPVFGLLFSIIADFIAGFPTILKSYQKPQEEDISPFIVGILGQFVLFLTLKDFNIFTLTFPIYLILFNCTVCIPLIIHHSKSNK